MAYFQFPDLEDVFPESRLLDLALDDGEMFEDPEITLAALEAGTFDAGSVEAKVQRRLSQAVKAAEAKANGILGAKIQVPVDSPTDDLLLAVKQIAVRLLFQRKQETEDGYKREYDEAVAMLEAIRDGENQVPGAASTDGPVSTYTGSDAAGSRMEYGGGGLDEF